MVVEELIDRDGTRLKVYEAHGGPVIALEDANLEQHDFWLDDGDIDHLIALLKQLKDAISEVH